MILWFTRSLVTIWLTTVLGVIAYASMSASKDALELIARIDGTYVGDLGSAAVLGTAFAPLPIIDLLTGEPDTLQVADRDVLLLVYSINCGPCNTNMPSWIDVITESAAAKVDIVAISRHELPAEDSLQPRFLNGLRAARDTANQRLYWRGLTSHVRLVVPTHDAMLQPSNLFRATPSTILIRDGHIAAAFVGALASSQESWLIQALHHAR